ncbi:PREDICTED: bromodomain-containing protein 8-like isoform X2 [Hipposideros armiger]|uniref:Bromodomain-containing protein 8-like isoform X2 n=1 Tax=Hipposideros armiger TaxID=186990 RepID=A0A8B7SV99_HIPAR|nr:PREDICTED: bromodomain-containing protein 8-like isoform X2 [Hipposideros armiger]
MMSRKKFLAPYLSTERGTSKCLRNIDLSESNALFSVYLQMGHEWVWLDSEQDYPNDSELSNDCRSLFSSWDSSLDLDMGSWRETEDPGAEEVEESSPGRAPSELLVGDGGSEESQEEAEPVSSQNLLHFLSEGEVQQESKGEDQGKGYVSEMEEQPSTGECVAGFSTQAAPLVDILYSGAPSSKLSDLSQSDPVQDHLLFKKTLLPVWKMIASHRFSSPFLKPVSERQAPGYKDVVKRPMDLTTLKRNLSKGRIRTMAQFQRDLMLMFQNAVMYNDSDHHVYHMAVEMQREVLEQIQVLSIWLDKRRDVNSPE